MQTKLKMRTPQSLLLQMILGFIFVLLGGYMGIAFGFNYAFGNYTKGTKRLGWIMIILGFFSISQQFILRIAQNIGWDIVQMSFAIVVALVGVFLFSNTQITKDHFFTMHSL